MIIGLYRRRIVPSVSLNSHNYGFDSVHQTEKTARSQQRDPHLPGIE